MYSSNNTRTADKKDGTQNTETRYNDLIWMTCTRGQDTHVIVQLTQDHETTYISYKTQIIYKTASLYFLTVRSFGNKKPIDLSKF